MPDIEDMLLGDDDDSPKSEPESREKAAFAQMRKELKALKTEAEELRAFKAQAEQQNRQAAVADVFTQIGLKPKHAKFYPTDGDTSAEAVRVWAIAEELLEVEEGEEQAPPPHLTEGFTPTVIADGATPAAKRWTREEFEAGMRVNPDLWGARASAGKVKWNNL